MARRHDPDGASAAEREELIGRAVEIDLAVEHLAEHGQVLLSGEAGIGKTSLLKAVARRLEASGFRCVAATGTAALAEHPLAGLAHLLGDLADGPTHELQRRATDGLMRLAPGSTAVMVLDDAPLLDPWSLHAVIQARAGDGPRILAAARSDDGIGDTVASIGRGDGIRIELQRLSAAETARLAERELGAPLDSVSATQIHIATDGLPLAISELLRYARRAGALVERAGLWRWNRDVTIDPQLARLLGLRIDGLTGGAREVIDLISVADELPAAVVRELVPDVDIAELEALRLVIPSAKPGWLAPAHPLLRDACLTRLEPLRRRALLERLVDALAPFAEDDPELERRRVITSVEIGAPVDVESLLATVAWGVGHGLWRLLAPVMQHAWLVLPSSATGLAFAEALYWTGEMDVAAEVLEAAERLCRTDAERVTVAVTRARTLNVGLGRWDEAVATRQSVHVDLVDPILRLDVQAAEAYELVHRGEARTVAEILRTVDRTAPAEALSDEARAVAWGAARYRLTQATIGALGVLGRIDDMATEYVGHREGRDTHDKVHPLAATGADVWWTVTGLIAGRRELVLDVALERASASLGLDDGITRPIWSVPMAVDHWLAGRLDLAELSAREALGISGEVPTVTRLGRHVLVRVLELQGHHAAALELCREPEPDDYFSLVRHWGTGVREICKLAVARTLVRPDDRERAAARVLDVATRLQEQGQVMAAAYLCHDTLRIGRARLGPVVAGRRAAAMLDQLAAQCDAPTVAAMALHADAAVRHDPSTLLSTARDVAARGDGTLCVLILRDALVLAAEQRDHQLITELEAVRDGLMLTGWDQPAVPTPPATDLGLSARELQVARAAASGASDREIAEALSVSVRTVHAHLRAVFRKLDVHRRDELASLSVLHEPRSM